MVLRAPDPQRHRRPATMQSFLGACRVKANPAGERRRRGGGAGGGRAEPFAGASGNRYQMPAAASPCCAYRHWCAAGREADRGDAARIARGKGTRPGNSRQPARRQSACSFPAGAPHEAAFRKRTQNGTFMPRSWVLPRRRITEPSSDGTAASWAHGAALNAGSKRAANDRDSTRSSGGGYLMPDIRCASGNGRGVRCALGCRSCREIAWDQDWPRMKSDGNGPLQSELPAKGLGGQLFAATPNLTASCADKKSARQGTFSQAVYNPVNSAGQFSGAAVSQFRRT